jgi:F0F1-type ATP synthase assembly protein I
LKVPNARQFQQGPGDPLSKAFELVVTPAIFGFLGFLLDRWLGTVPLFTALLSVFTLSYLVWRLYADYTAEMERHDRDKPWTRDARRREAVGG